MNNWRDSLWSLYDTLPDLKVVDEAWQLVVEADKSDLLKEFYGIADNPKKLLIYLAIQHFNKHGNLCATETAKKYWHAYNVHCKSLSEHDIYSNIEQIQERHFFKIKVD